MRIAALLLGLIAGLFALLAPSALRVDLMSPFLEFWTATSNERLLATIVWYAIAGAALLGGVLATVTPGFAALLLIGAAAGWLAIAISVPQLFTYHLLAPAGAAGTAALFAFLAGELQVRRRRLARRNRRLAAEAPEDKDSEFEREAALRMDPMLMPRQDASPPPRRSIPLTLDDVTVTARPTSVPPRWQDLDTPQPPRRHDPDMWAEARREQHQPEPEAPRATVAPELRAEVREREPEVRRREPELRERDPELRRREPEARRDPQRRRPAATRPERGSVWVAVLAAVGTLLGVAILAAGGYLIYRDGSLDALFAQPAAAPAAVISSEAAATPTRAPESAAATTVAATPAPPVKLELPAAPDVPVAANPTTPAPAAEATEPALAPTRVAAAPAPQSYDDPFAYCRAVGTIDYIDSRYAGPAVTPGIAHALLIPPGSARDRVRWRCVDGDVLACTSYIGPICDMAPTVLEMREFCERNPNVEQLLAPSGTWSCADGRPQLPADAHWPVDERGFLPRGWVKVPDAGTATAG